MNKSAGISRQRNAHSYQTVTTKNRGAIHSSSFRPEETAMNKWTTAATYKSSGSGRRWQSIFVSGSLLCFQQWRRSKGDAASQIARIAFLIEQPQEIDYRPREVGKPCQRAEGDIGMALEMSKETAKNRGMWHYHLLLFPPNSFLDGTADIWIIKFKSHFPELNDRYMVLIW